MTLIAEDFPEGDENDLVIVNPLGDNLKVIVSPDCPTILWTEVWHWEITDIYEISQFYSGHAPTPQCAAFCARLALRLLSIESPRWNS